VIHTVGPVYATDPEPLRALVSCHVESLRVADELGARTVAFPAISTGAYGYPLSEAAPIAVASAAAADVAVGTVRFVVFGPEAFARFTEAQDLVSETFHIPDAGLTVDEAVAGFVARHVARPPDGR